MRSPLFFSDTSFPSPSNQPGPHAAAEEVDSLLATASKVTVLDTVLQNVFTKHKYLFLDVFSRQVELLKSRSQALEDAHVTVYDKVLLSLTRHGNDLENVAAITWYACQYLCYNPNGGQERNTQLIKQGLSLPVAIAKGSSFERDRNTETKRTIAQGMIDDDGINSPPPTSSPRKDDRILPSKGDSKFSHLWSVYEKARNEYLAVADRKDDRTLENARFLRDTAENGIHYLSGYPQPEERLITELKSTYHMAEHVVESLSGGKKRKFDHVSDRAEHHRHPRRTATPSNRGRKSFVDAHEGRISKRHRNPGRGPSGIPFGYSKTRRVDSYVPHKAHTPSRR